MGDYVTAGQRKGSMLGKNATAEGINVLAMVDVVHAEGHCTCAAGFAAHAENNQTEARGESSHAEGYFSKSEGSNSHAEGNHTHSIADNSHAEGYTTVSNGYASHSEGGYTTADGDHSHAEGENTLAEGKNSHAENHSTKAAGDNSHAEGEFTVANGMNSHAQGQNTTAFGDISTAMGENTVAQGRNQVVMGKWNATDESSLLIIGKGTGINHRSNAFRVDPTGAVFSSGAYGSVGADYAEMFEWEDRNPNNEDRVGKFVTLDGKYIKIAQPEDTFILGVVSGQPSICGDTTDDHWDGMYLRDIYGRVQMEEVTIPAVIDTVTHEDGSKEDIIKYPERKEIQQKINPAYNPNEKYVPRSLRPEWDAVGLLGKLVVQDDGHCNPSFFCKVGKDGIAIPSVVQTKFRVMERLDSNHIKILIL